MKQTLRFRPDGKFKVLVFSDVHAADTAYTTYMARGEALFAQETTPTVNGAIAWQYE